jgi:hypothetical protein
MTDGPGLMARVGRDKAAQIEGAASSFVNRPFNCGRSSRLSSTFGNYLATRGHVLLPFFVACYPRPLPRLVSNY